MGRPLNKKYFGNRNIGTTGSGDDGLGGNRVASVTLDAGNLGSYTTQPTVTFSDPDLLGAGAVRATGTVTSEAKTASISGSQTRGYPVGTGSITYGSSTWTPTITTGALSSVIGASATQISFTTTTTAMISGTSIHITGTGAGNVTIGETALVTGQIYYVGSPTTATAATLYANYNDSVNAANPLAITGTTTTGFTFTRGVTYGTVTAVTVANRGSFAGVLTTGAQAVTSTSGSYGAGLTITVTYRAKSVTITNAGSGYSDVTDAAPTFSQSVLGTTVLEVDGSGSPYTVGVNENAITVSARIPTVDGGISAKNSDIVKQVGARRYKVKNADGTGVCKLVVTSPGAGECRITAKDSDGDTYYVSKINSRRATVTAGTGTQFATGDSVPWTFGNATEDETIQIVNT